MKKFIILENEKKEILNLYFNNSNSNILLENENVESNTLKVTLSKNRILTFEGCNSFFSIKINLIINKKKEPFQTIDNSDSKNYIQSDVLPKEIETEKQKYSVEFLLFPLDLNIDMTRGILKWGDWYYSQVTKDEVIVNPYKGAQYKFKQYPNTDFTEKSIERHANSPWHNRWVFKKQDGKYYYKRNVTKSSWIETAGDVELAIAYLYYDEYPEHVYQKWETAFDYAKQYWKNWLSNETTIQKLKFNWLRYPKEMNKNGCISNSKNVFMDNNIKSLVLDKYYKLLDNLKFVIYSKYQPSLYKDNETAVAYVPKKLCATDVNIFCNYDFTNKKNLKSALIHEIQHALYDISPLNPDSKVSQTFNNNLDKKEINMSQIYNAYIKYGKKVVDTWIDASLKEENEDPGYVCKETEKLSNIQSMREMFKVGPGQNITEKMLEPYIKFDVYDGNVAYYLCCWALRGFEDIEKMLEKTNALALKHEKSKENNINNLEKDTEA